MLHWFAGQKAPDGPNDPDATGYIEPPETPAPVFAVRAFKHAIFGTPQTTQPNPRRYSNAENVRPKNIETKPTRPGMNRPKSASDAHALAKQDAQLPEESLSSPTKGILLTPGTAAARKKNVTFGEHVVDNEEKRPLKSGLPDDCPGKFPSPWNKSAEDPKKADETGEKGRGRSKLTEVLEQVRDDSRKRKSKVDKRGKNMDDDEDDPIIDLAEPRSEAGKYWKREYDIYRANTQREVKKLVTKQKAAKSFAQAKDSQCTELSDQLRQEQRKVDTLEAKTTELTSQMKDLQEKLRASQDEITMLKRQLGRKDSVRPGSSDARNGPHERHSPEQQPAIKERAKAEEDAVQRPSEPYNPSEIAKAKTDTLTSRARAKSKPDTVPTKSTEDIWAQSFRSSSPVASRTTDRRPLSPKAGRPVTSGTDATPLMTLSINTLQSGPDSRRTSSPGSLDVECKSTPELERRDSKTSAMANEGQRKDSPMRSPDLPLLSSEMQAAAWPVQNPKSSQRKEVEEKHDDSSIQVPFSSPFQPDAKTLAARSGPAGPRAAPESKPGFPNNIKENISPASKPHTPQNELNVRPSVMWSSINAPQAGKRSASIMDKDGKEVSLDRIEAAKARLAAKGRIVSGA